VMGLTLLRDVAPVAHAEAEPLEAAA
jgi:hypothetical protein